MLIAVQKLMSVFKKESVFFLPTNFQLIMFMYQERGKGNEERILEKGQEQEEKLFGFKNRTS